MPLPMYIPAAFREDDPAHLRALIRAHPLATLVVQGDGGLVANHLPLLLHERDGRVALRGHVARANPLWRSLGDGCPALAVFHGPQAYVSPGWYPSKRVDGRVVPTWNYAVVHAHGTLAAIDDPAWVHGLVCALTDVHEAQQPEPWAVSDAPDDFVEQMVRAVVGIELAVARLEGKWKMSQNRAAADRDGVVQGLRGLGDAADEAFAALVAGARRGSESG